MFDLRSTKSVKSDTSKKGPYKCLVTMVRPGSILLVPNIKVVHHNSVRKAGSMNYPILQHYYLLTGRVLPSEIATLV